MRGLGFFKEFAEQKMEGKEERERVKKTVCELQSTYAKDEKVQQRLKYGEFLTTLPLEKNRILYEAFSGRGMICNPCAIFKYLMSHKEYQKYEHIWVIDDFEDNQAQMEEYKNCGRVHFVKYQSEDYLRALATSKYLINNVGFPGFFTKRKGQVYLNTWHGSPMKTMGFDIPGGNVSAGNSAKNLLAADYVLSQSPYMTKTAWLGSYKMQGIYEGTILENGFPRNDIFFHPDKERILEKLRKHGVKIDPDKKTILYAPTWKGEKYSSPRTSLEEYFRVIETIEANVDPKEYQVLVKPHQIVYYYSKNSGDTTGQFLPATLDTNEILSVVDVLISDYSSIHFDFLVSGKPMVFFLPDLMEFEGYRGLYFGLDKLPGPICKDYEELGECFAHLEEAQKPYEVKYQEEKSWAASRDDGEVCRKVAETIFDKKHPGVEVVCRQTEKKKLLLYAGAFEKNETTMRFLSFLQLMDFDKLDVTLLAQENPETGTEFLNHLPREVRVLFWKPYYAGTLEEYARHELAAKHKVCLPYDFYRREWKRAVGECSFDLAADFSGSSEMFRRILEQRKEIKNISKELKELKTPVNLAQLREEEAAQTTISCRNETLCIADVKHFMGTVELETLAFPSAKCVNLAAMGCFLPENHFGELVRVFDRLYKEKKDLRLYFLGDGPSREKIEKLAAEHGLTEAVIFTGELKYPLTFLKKCQYFLLESKKGEEAIEVLTARTLGLPVVTRYSELSMALKGKVHKPPFDAEAYNREIKKAFNRLFEV